MSDTPRTDAFEALPERPINWWDFARQMERENAALREAAAIEEERSLYWRAAEDKLKRENTELADFVERHEDALRLLRIWAAKPMHGTNCDDLREETLAFLKTQ